jgi:hypothetical protein
VALPKAGTGFNALLELAPRLPGDKFSGDRVRLGALTAEHWQIIRSEDSVLSPSAQGMTNAVRMGRALGVCPHALTSALVLQPPPEEGALFYQTASDDQ